MARKRLKQTKAAIAARRRYRAKKRRGGGLIAPRRLPNVLLRHKPLTKADIARMDAADRRAKARMTPAMKRLAAKRKAAAKKYKSTASFKAATKRFWAKARKARVQGKAKKGKRGSGFFLPALAAMFLPKLLGMGK